MSYDILVRIHYPRSLRNIPHGPYELYTSAYAWKNGVFEGRAKRELMHFWHHCWKIGFYGVDIADICNANEFSARR
ncbi:hypothetical protein VTL71DRAFT_8510 [Oculimacula yallundae]|uniref:Uncharacterized protein n=1 Tax=Oculimacula yallundae TaxID=86028 RepID=A0ABR4D026_9HELO